MKFRIGNVSKAWGFFKLLRILFIFGTIISLLVTGFNLWNEHHQIEPILEEMGTVFNPLYTLSENSENILTEGLFVKTGHLFKDIVQFFRNVYSILEPLIIVYIWMYYLDVFFSFLIFGDKSKRSTFPSLLLSFIFFCTIQLLYVGVITELPLKTPFVAIKDLFRIIVGFFN